MKSIWLFTPIIFLSAFSIVAYDSGGMQMSVVSPGGRSFAVGSGGEPSHSVYKVAGPVVGGTAAGFSLFRFLKKKVKILFQDRDCDPDICICHECFRDRCERDEGLKTVHNLSREQLKRLCRAMGMLHGSGCLGTICNASDPNMLLREYKIHAIEYLSQEAQELLHKRLEETKKRLRKESSRWVKAEQQRQEVERQKQEAELKKKREAVQKITEQEVLELLESGFVHTCDDTLESIQDMRCELSDDERVETLDDALADWEFRIEKRRQAFEKVQQGEVQHYEKTYAISPQTAEFVRHYEGDPTVYSRCWGNELQHVLHEEFVDIIHDAAERYHVKQYDGETQEQLDEINRALVSFAQAGCGHIKAGNIKNAIAVSDFCHGLYAYSEAVALGAWDAVVDTYEIFRHPVHTAKNLASVACSLLNKLGSFVKDLDDMSCDSETPEGKERYEKAVARLKKKWNKVTDYTSMCWEHIKNSSGTDRVRFLTRMGVGFVLPAKGMKALSSVAKFAKPQVIQFINGFKTGGRFVAAAANTGGATGRLMNVARRSGQACRRAVQVGRSAASRVAVEARTTWKVVKSRGCNTCKSLLSSGQDLSRRACSGCSQVAQALQEACARGTAKFRRMVHADKWLTKGTKVVLKKTRLGMSEEQIIKLNRFFGSVVETCGEVAGEIIPRRIRIDKKFLEHIFSGELEALMDCTEAVKATLNGFHFDVLGIELKNKALKLVNVTRNKATGAYKGFFRKGGGRLVEKSFFPEHWTAEKVVEKIMEAAKNIEKVQEKLGVRHRVIGKTTCGMQIQLILEPGGQLITAFPIF